MEGGEKTTGHVEDIIENICNELISCYLDAGTQWSLWGVNLVAKF